jgi:hypothetical protein
MIAETPATGILKQGDFGSAVFYYIECDCCDPDCAHAIEVEADELEVSVHVYVRVHTKWWEKARWKQLWQLISRGYVDTQSTIVLKEQTALNYAETLKSAISDVKKFKDERFATNAGKTNTNSSRAS